MNRNSSFGILNDLYVGKVAFSQNKLRSSLMLSICASCQHHCSRCVRLSTMNRNLFHDWVPGCFLCQSLLKIDFGTVVSCNDDER